VLTQLATAAKNTQPGEFRPLRCCNGPALGRTSFPLPLMET